MASVVYRGLTIEKKTDCFEVVLFQIKSLNVPTCLRIPAVVDRLVKAQLRVTSIISGTMAVNQCLKIIHLCFGMYVLLALSRNNSLKIHLGVMVALVYNSSSMKMEGGGSRKPSVTHWIQGHPRLHDTLFSKSKNIPSITCFSSTELN